MSTLGDRVRAERVRQGITQDELAKKAGYSSRTSINKIENGRPASLKVVHKLAEALNVSEWYLLGSCDAEDTTPCAEIKDKIKQMRTYDYANGITDNFINYLRCHIWQVEEVSDDVDNGKEITEEKYFVVTNENGVSIKLTQEELDELDKKTSEYVETLILNEFKKKLGL
ncbi:helix-turn-helix domain-containing protein [Holdemanella biformis]|uniref:helix-turn-helix domain-containing protein n=1 Tax=Holdemanella biformis TaxID=1735 RepID=UPI001C27F8E7|nr:helix-turn-helix transcriptional regulator [Holdemanella biformis]MBU9894895.1 helix-turn-helix domain-containing protein [Holdemanella biformis]MBV3415938.1 helix-turn-helix domain-containing protein [Holdemanella biformis]